jgi:HEAT repeat protein
MPLFGPPNIEKLTAKRDVQGLINALSYMKDSDQEKHYDIRRQAAEVLGEMGDARAVKPLIAAFNDKEISVREEAAHALGKIGDGSAVDALIDAFLFTQPNFVGKPAVEALRKIGADRAVDTFTGALKNRDKWIRHKAAEGLGVMGDARAVEALIDALNDKEDLVRREAASSLGEIRDARAMNPLIAALKDKDFILRIAAAKALGNVGGTLGMYSLIHALYDDQVEVRVAAAEALGKLGDARAASSLIRAFEDKDAEVCIAAEEALGRIDPIFILIAQHDWEQCVARGRVAVEPLIAALDIYNLGEAAARVLVRIGMPAVGPLVTALADAHWGNSIHRDAAAKVLVEIYHSGRVDEACKQQILAIRGAFAREHTDEETWDSKCQMKRHSDSWSGVDL